MSKYDYNGVVLPSLPEVDGYPYKLIVSISDTNEYFLMFETEPFVVIESRITFPVDSRYIVYRCSADDTAWTTGVIDVEEGTSEYIAIDTRAIYIWTNSDISDTDGNIVYSGTEPMEVVLTVAINSTAMTLGRLMGRRIAAQRKKRQLVAYLYDGVRLPKLPEWNKEAYPYGWIFSLTGSSFGFHLCSERPYIYAETGYMRGPSGALTDMGWLCNSNRMTKWIAESTNGNGRTSTGEDDMVVPLWTNFDLLDDNGDLFLAASEPVPVYE